MRVVVQVRDGDKVQEEWAIEIEEHRWVSRDKEGELIHHPTTSLARAFERVASYIVDNYF